MIRKTTNSLVSTGETLKCDNSTKLKVNHVSKY